MDDVNLLPWREARRKVRRRAVWLGSVLGIVVITVIADVMAEYLHQWREPLHRQVQMLEQQQREAQQRLQKILGDLDARSLAPAAGPAQPQRAMSAGWGASQLRQAAASIPDTLWLTQLRYLSSSWQLEGQGVSRRDVVTFARGMTAWQWQGLSHTDTGRWQFTLHSGEVR